MLLYVSLAVRVIGVYSWHNCYRRDSRCSLSYFWLATFRASCEVIFQVGIQQIFFDFLVLFYEDLWVNFCHSISTISWMIRTSKNDCVNYNGAGIQKIVKCCRKVDILCCHNGPRSIRHYTGGESCVTVCSTSPIRILSQALQNCVQTAIHSHFSINSANAMCSSMIKTWQWDTYTHHSQGVTSKVCHAFINSYSQAVHQILPTNTIYMQCMIRSQSRAGCLHSAADQTPTDMRAMTAWFRGVFLLKI